MSAFPQFLKNTSILYWDVAHQMRFISQACLSRCVGGAGTYTWFCARFRPFFQNQIDGQFQSPRSIQPYESFNGFPNTLSSAESIRQSASKALTTAMLERQTEFSGTKTGWKVTLFPVLHGTATGAPSLNSSKMLLWLGRGGSWVCNGRHHKHT